MLSHPGAQLLIRLPVAISSDCPSQPHLVHPSHVVASPGHGAAPPGHTVAPPGHIMASPGHSMAPPSHITASSNRIAAPPGLIVASPGHPMAPLGHTTAPHGHFMAPPDHIVECPGHAMAPPSHITSSPDHTTASPGHIMASSGHSMASPDSDGSCPCLEALQAGSPSPVSCRGHQGGHQQQGRACPPSHGGTRTTLAVKAKPMDYIGYRNLSGVGDNDLVPWPQKAGSSLSLPGFSSSHLNSPRAVGVGRG